MSKKEKEKSSLVTLTQKFLQVLASSKQREMDLVEMERILGISKRRLYDVTNVLLGVGIIEHSSKSKVRMIQKSFEMNEQKGLEELALKEREIDIMREIVDNEIENIQKSIDFDYYAYLTKEDIKKLIQTEPLTFFAFQSPPDLKLEVEEEDNIYKLHCSSDIGGVDLIEI